MIGVPLVVSWWWVRWPAGGSIPGRTAGPLPLTIILFCVLAQQLSMLPFRILDWPRPDCLAVGIEVTMRNINLALLLIPTLVSRQLQDEQLKRLADGVLFVVLFYAAAAMGAGLPLAVRHRLKSANEVPHQDRSDCADRRSVPPDRPATLPER